MTTKSVKVTNTVSAKHNPSFFTSLVPGTLKHLRVETRGDEAGFLLKYDAKMLRLREKGF